MSTYSVDLGGRGCSSASRWWLRLAFSSTSDRCASGACFINAAAQLLPLHFTDEQPAPALAAA